LTNLRRSRGYGWESYLVKKFNSLDDWRCRRLGGSSTGLPDLVAVNNEQGLLYCIEAKSGYSKYLYIPTDQVCRCINIANMFGLYKTTVVFSFKFGRGYKNEQHYFLPKHTYSDFSEYSKHNVRCNTGHCIPNERCIVQTHSPAPYYQLSKFEMPWQ
jgi:Holliday junction resolvase